MPSVWISKDIGVPRDASILGFKDRLGCSLESNSRQNSHKILNI